MKRKSNETISEVKNNLEKLKGAIVQMQVNKGRKKLVKFDAEIKDVYPSVFTVLSVGIEKNIHSYSYAEILCGKVVINSLHL